MTTDGSDPAPPHRLADHRYGAGMDDVHAHGDAADHDHDHDEFGAAPGAGEAAWWVQDNVVVTSVGIDIGSAGTQVAFSRIRLSRVADQLSTRYVVVSREPVYQSPSLLTPLSRTPRRSNAPASATWPTAASVATERSGRAANAAAPKLAPEPHPFEAFKVLVRTPREAMPRLDARFVSDEQLRAIHVYLGSIQKGPVAKDIAALRLEPR